MVPPETVEYARLEALQEHAIRTFNLSVRGRMGDRRPVDLDVIIVTELQKFTSCELCSIVRDYGVRHSESVDNVEEELYRFFRPQPSDGTSFNPLCKLVDGDKNVCEAPGRLLEGSDQVQTPYREGPRDGDGLEGLGRQVCLPSIVLTPLAGANDVRRVVYCCRPVETLSEGVPDQRPRRGVVAAHTGVDVAQELLPLFDGDAALQYATHTSLVELFVEDHKRLSAARDAPSFHLIRW